MHAQDHSNRKLSGSSRWILILFILVGGSLPRLATSQTIRSSSFMPKNDPEAIAVVKSAISSLGGDAVWQSIGAATANVTVSSPSSERTTIRWSDDWSSGYAQSRRDTTRNDGSVATMIATNMSATRHLANGNIQQLPSESDIARVASGYPAAALSISLRRHDCAFHFAHSSHFLPFTEPLSNQDTVIEELCREPSMVDGVVQFVWHFSKSTGLPLSVTSSVSGVLHRLISYQTVSYVSFQTIEKAVIPTELAVSHSGGHTEALSISDTSFTSALQTSTFHLTR